MKKLSILVLGMAFVLSASLVFAGPRGWGHGMGPGYGWCPYTDSNLNLTEEQSAKLQTLRETYLKEITPLQNQVFVKKSELRLLWNAANPDRDKIMAKQNEINKLQQQIQEKATQYQFEIRNILTPEQRPKVRNFGPGYGYGPGWKMQGRW